MRIIMGIDEAFARVVSEEMTRQHVSVAWLAVNSGIANRTLRSILSADHHVKLVHVCQISDAVGIPCAEMVARAHLLLKP